MMKKSFLGVLMGLLMLIGALLPVSVFAANCADVKFFGLDPWYANLTCDDSGNISQDNFTTGSLTGTILGIIGVVVKDLLFLAGFAAVVLIIVGGIKYMLSAGDPAGINKATKTITGAVTGLIIAILAYAIVTFILKAVKAM